MAPTTRSGPARWPSGSPSSPVGHWSPSRGGHGLPARDPVRTNLLIKEFADRVGEVRVPQITSPGRVARRPRRRCTCRRRSASVVPAAIWRSPGSCGSCIRICRSTVLDAVPAARRLEPALRFLMVTGPRIDPTSLPRTPGVWVRGYVPELYRLLAAADLAIVQGGLTTCMELTACGTAFIYVPLRNHFEQNLHVRHRLDRYQADRHLAYDDARDPDLLAAAMVAEVHSKVDYHSVETGGAARAAAMLSALL